MVRTEALSHPRTDSKLTKIEPPLNPRISLRRPKQSSPLGVRIDIADSVRSNSKFYLADSAAQLGAVLKAL